MVSERIQRRIEALLDEADQAVTTQDWLRAAGAARAVLAIDEGNSDAADYLKMAAANGEADESPPSPASASMAAESAPPGPTPAANPDSFVGGRYRVLRFLGEGGKKRVFLAHDETLDRNVAFAVIKSDGLDHVGRQRIVREAQAMGRLGSNPNIVSIFDIGEEQGAPYVVTELMGGGDVEGLLEKAEAPLPIQRTLEIAKDVARGLVFAHANQVVHRDLKPGNVWLTADGVAKIGDFGLAVSLDRSRLTQHGFMVGTVNYMPPEQALGGETTPQSDLYSLGAMLYELVTGKPPFGGDDSTAIISQHINTPPVAPSWQSASCPPELEDLVLKLLAKAPQDRPASAQQVLDLLGQVDPTAPSRRHTGSDANPLDRLARGIFVGREKELERLRSAFDDAFTGRGSMVMLVGEPGIGKTRISQALETYARVRGAQVLWGRNHESAGAPAFHPWIQVGRQWGAANDLSLLVPVLAADGGDLTLLFPELRQVVPGFTEPPTIGDPAAAQFHLFESFTAFIRAASIARPLVLVLDDIHWADKPSLLLLQHLARELTNMRVLIIGAYRDTELVRTHPLSEALASLNRDGGFLRVSLKGLTRNEVAAYLDQRAGMATSSELVSRIYEATEGNPFFLSEVVNLLTQEGTLGQKHTSEIALPEGVREALGRRLDRVSEEANGLLRVAAVIGREFNYETLEMMDAGNGNALLGLIEEGLAARVIEEMERPGYYRFTHALMQETLLEELSTTRRVRLHGEVAEALERRWGSAAINNASRLALHYAESATLTAAHVEKAVLYLEAAARQSEVSLAWTDAAAAYERIFQLNKDIGRQGDPRTEGLMLARWARCLGAARDFRGAWRNFYRALSLFRELGFDADYARTMATALEMSTFTWPSASALQPMITHALESSPAAEPEVRGRLLLAKMWLAIFDDDQPTFQALADELRSIVATGRSSSLQAAAEVMELGFVRQRIGTDEQESLRQALASVRMLESGGLLGEAAAQLQGVAAGRLGRGHLDEAGALLHRQAEDGKRAGLSMYVFDAEAKLAGIRLLRGGSAIAGGEAIEGQWVMEIFRSYERLMSTGDPAPLPDLALAGNVPWQTANVLVHRIEFRALAGDLDGAARDAHELDALLPEVVKMAAPLVRLARAYLGARWLRESALNPRSYAPTGILAQNKITWVNVIPRMYGELALAGGDFELAESSLMEALDWCVRERCPVEEGRCLQALAELAEKRGDHASATHHLDRAADLFQQYGARLFLEQVLAKKDVLKA